MKVIHFFNIYNPTGISKYIFGWGCGDFYSPRQCIIGRLLTGEMVVFRLECGKKVDVKTEEKRWLERTNRTSAVLKQILLDEG